MKEAKIYSFNDIERKTLEGLSVPLTIYQFLDKKVIPILISDGMCVFERMTREQVFDMFVTDMYRNVHPDDAKVIPKAAYDFATKGGTYNVTYRERLGGIGDYRILHAAGEHVWRDDGTRLAYIRYDDITDALDADAVNAMESRKQVDEFFDDNMEAMAVVAQADNQLLYYNKAMCRMLPPNMAYDSGITFNKFFYGDSASGFPELLSLADAGPKMIVEPRSGRNIEVSVLTASWENSPAYLVYFYEYENEGKQSIDEKRHRRISFNKTMFSGNSNDLDYTDSGYKAFWVWNMTRGGKLVRDEGHKFVHSILGDDFDYDTYRRHLIPLAGTETSRKLLEAASLDAVIAMYYNQTYPKKSEVTVNSRKGNVTLKSDWVMMESPDTGDVYLKITEENVTNEQVLRTMIHTLLGERFDFIAYIDAPAGKCRIFDEKMISSDTLGNEMDLDKKCAHIGKRLGLDCASGAALIQKLKEKCNGGTEFTDIVEFNEIRKSKSIHINALDKSGGSFFVTSSDITEPLRREKDLQAKLRAALGDAEKAGVDRDNFIARTSHDLRTPLSAVISLSAFGKESAETLKQQDYFTKIRNSGEFMLAMLNDIIEIEKLRMGNFELHPTAVKQKDLIQDIETVVRPRADEKKIHLEIDPSVYGPDDKFIKVDRQRIQQILNNIIGNAIKYTPESGAVCWSGKDVVNADGSRAFVHFIRDNGVGMSVDFQEHLFEPYAREQNALSSHESGTGLGLAIVKKLIDALGGSIEVRSELGTGTAFTVTLPYAGADKIPATSAATEIPACKDYDFSGKTALICEDNEINQEIITALLEKTHIRMLHEYNGKSGVERFKVTGCDIVLMDIMMPVMDGLAATREIRSTGSKIPIVALSANANESDVEKSKAAGMDAHLIKPIDPRKLYETLYRFLRPEQGACR